LIIFWIFSSLLAAAKSILRAGATKDTTNDTPSGAPGDEEADRLSDDDEYDGDATLAKTRRRYMDEQDYDGEDEEKDEVHDESDCK
jgi:hypothetical protein